MAKQSARTALLIGPDFFGYNESIARALTLHGYRTEVIDSPTYTPRGIINRLRIDLGTLLGVHRYAEAWRAKFNAEIQRRAEALKPDLLLIIKGDWVNPATFRAMPAKRKAIWFHDSARRSGRDHRALTEISDAAFVFEPSDIPYLQGARESNVHFLPMGFDPEMYRPKLEIEKEVDICFVGRLYDNRKAILNRLLSDLPRARIEIWGRYVRYKEPLTWIRWAYNQAHPRLRGCFINQNVSSETVNIAYNRSRIILSIHHGQSKLGCNPRSFEICDAGAFQITDANRCLNETMGEGITQFTSYEDLRDKLVFYLSSPDERRRIAAIGHERARDHTFDARILVLLDRLGFAGEALGG